MEITLLLLALLFIGGLLKIYFCKPTKKFNDWLHFLVPKCSSSSSTASTSPVSITNTTSQVISDKERSSSTSELKRVFATFDKDGDGFITKKELKESLKNLRIMVSEHEVEELVTKVDSNGDGLIDFDEFCILCDESSFLGKESGDQKGGGEGDLKEAFDVFDKDKDGLISVEELGSVLDSLGLKEGRKIEDCQEMIRKVDMDGDGMVNFDEFKMMMMRSGGSRLVSVF
ncbi:calcium-binding family protein [Tripterygium wilfordii]|uniref:Calcium-binding family protein n=1 Tax=Tripterygium wilfordii TaxID=458696 RepID=A0A7J7D6M6_TRIWF|nr:calmodulin-like protein 2 [Tripterygium wilfordii]KAF5742007.1 calcium-binding family protein [Tripterygium wilfordii]